MDEKESKKDIQPADSTGEEGPMPTSGSEVEAGAATDEAGGGDINETCSPEAAATATTDTAEAVESERFLRLAAEFDNYRKRTGREFSELIRGANSRLLRDLIDIVDNFERALQSNDSGGNAEAYRKGVGLIYNQLQDFLKREQVAPIETVGQPFNPDLHDALLQQESSEYDEGIIIQEVQKGYYLHDRVLRHARVIVSAGPGKTETKEKK